MILCTVFIIIRVFGACGGGRLESTISPTVLVDSNGRARNRINELAMVNIVKQFPVLDVFVLTFATDAIANSVVPLVEVLFYYGFVIISF